MVFHHIFHIEVVRFSQCLLGFFCNGFYSADKRVNTYPFRLNQTPIPTPNIADNILVMMSEYKTSRENNERDPTRAKRIEYPGLRTALGCSNFQSL